MKTFSTFWMCLICLLNLTQSDAAAKEIRILSWNVESDRPNVDTNDPQVIAAQLREIQEERGDYDLIALTEVAAFSQPIYRQAANSGKYEYLDYMTETGYTDRMMLLARKDRFDVVGSGAYELTESGGEGKNDVRFPGGGSRRPFVIELKDRHNEGENFYFMVNHLDRMNYLVRQSQARGLREWARLQNKPIVAVGDYNFDFDFGNLTGNQAMSIFMRNDPDREGKGYFVWKWVIPDQTVEFEGTNDADRRVTTTTLFTDTNWYGRGVVDDFRDSLLDFVFLAKEARQWKAEAHVIYREKDFPDDHRTSDHRPIEAIIDPQRKGLDIGGPVDQ